MGPHESLSKDLSNNDQCYRVNFYHFLYFLILVTDMTEVGLRPQMDKAIF
jgi:hypothetical protein